MSDFFSLLRVREATTVQDLSLALALATWLIIIYWLWRYGWRVQRRYFIEATLTPYKRTGIVWTSALFGKLVRSSINQSRERPDHRGDLRCALHDCPLGNALESGLAYCPVDGNLGGSFVDSF